MYYSLPINKTLYGNCSVSSIDEEGYVVALVLLDYQMYLIVHVFYHAYVICIEFMTKCLSGLVFTYPIIKRTLSDKHELNVGCSTGFCSHAEFVLLVCMLSQCLTLSSVLYYCINHMRQTSMLQLKCCYRQEDCFADKLSYRAMCIWLKDLFSIVAFPRHHSLILSIFSLCISLCCLYWCFLSWIVV